MKKLSIAFGIVLLICVGVFVWRLDAAKDVEVMVDKRQVMFPPRPAPFDQNQVQVVTVDRCPQSFAKGDGLMFKYFDSVTNTTYLEQALDEYSKLPVSVEAELRLALIKLAKLDGNGCQQHVKEALRLQPMNERALLYLGYCLEIMGDINGAKNAFLEARAMEIRGADRFWDMPSGYGPFNPFDRTFYRSALANCFMYTEFVQFGLRPGQDRWMNALIEQHLESFSTKFNSLAEVVKFFASKNYIILRGLLSPFEIHHLHTYYETNMNIFPNKEPFVTSCTNERMGYFYNQRFRPMVSAISNLPLLVTYSYFVNYYGRPNNPGLKSHTDAVDNEYTMSTHVTEVPYTPAWIWPIYFVEKPKDPVTELGTWEYQPSPNDAGVIPALLNPGDALLFRGRRHPHFREPLDGSHPNQSYGNMLSHFVKPDYPIWLRRDKHNEIYANDVNLPTVGHVEFQR